MSKRCTRKGIVTRETQCTGNPHLLLSCCLLRGCAWFLCSVSFLLYHLWFTMPLCRLSQRRVRGFLLLKLLLLCSAFSFSCLQHMYLVMGCHVRTATTSAPLLKHWQTWQVSCLLLALRLQGDLRLHGLPGRHGDGMAFIASFFPDLALSDTLNPICGCRQAACG